MPIYMQYDNGAIPGDVTEETHKDWIEISSCQLGVGRGISSPRPGAGRDREASDPSVSEITCSKMMDNASADLFKESLKGTGKKCKIEFCISTQEQGMRTYLALELENTMISSYSVSSGGDKPMESVSLNFTKIEYKYTPFDIKHAEEGKKIYSYDLATAKVS